jgi:hypothetical protein
MLALISKYRAIAISIVITATSILLSSAGIIHVDGFSPELTAAIFTVIVGSTATLFSILVVYGELIAAADEKEYLQDLERTFRWPVGTAVYGFVIAVVFSTISIDSQHLPEKILSFTPNDILNYLMLFILLYSILSFRQSFIFVLKCSIKMEAKNNINGEAEAQDPENP